MRNLKKTISKFKMNKKINRKIKLLDILNL